jgi:D-beta-D-heptose 7-phosphate kinase/D-beta-D-heptose 1-phosphate adenosyltransferase
MSSFSVILGAFRDRRILVVGDLMLDEYLWGTAERISPEAPVPVVLCHDRTHAPGGAANVVANIAALGATPVVCGIIGDDAPGGILLDKMGDLGADISGVLRDPDRCTTLKSRVIAHHQQVVRLDHETRAPVSQALHREMDAFLKSHVNDVDALIFSDYSKGVLTDHYLAVWIALSREQGKTVTAGPKPDSLRDYRGASLLSFNRTEAHQSVRNLGIANSEGDTAEAIEQIGRYLMRELQCDALTVTRGEEGVSVFTADGHHCQVAGMPVQVYDVAGAGDTFLSTVTLALCAGADVRTAAAIANAAAACVVRKVGVASTNREEIASLLNTATPSESRTIEHQDRFTNRHQRYR